MKKVLIWVFREAAVWVRYLMPIVLFIFVLNMGMSVYLKIVVLVCIFGWWLDSCKIDFLLERQLEQGSELKTTKIELIKVYGVLKRIENRGKYEAHKSKGTRLKH